MKNQLSRREALSHICALTSAVALNSSGVLANNQQTMLQREIPSTKERLPVVGLGSWIQFDVGKSETERQGLVQVLKSMNRLGGKLIDFSPMYGRAEEVIGDLTASSGYAGKFFYATKVWTTGRQAGIDQMNDSFRKMKRQKMDLMQVHNLQDWQTHIKTLKDWKEQGKIRYVGITHYTASLTTNWNESLNPELSISCNLIIL